MQLLTQNSVEQEYAGLIKAYFASLAGYGIDVVHVMSVFLQSDSAKHAHGYVCLCKTLDNSWALDTTPLFALSMSVCQLSQTAGRKSCSIVSGHVSNCSHRLPVNPVTSSRLSSA